MSDDIYPLFDYVKQPIEKEEIGRKENEKKAFNTLKQELKKGYISIEQIDGDQLYLSNRIVLILHIRDAGAPISISLVKEKHSHCILLTDKGCSLPYEKRPTGGKMLIPNYPECHNAYSLRDCCKEWLPFQSVLFDLYNYFRGHNTKCSV